MVARPGVPVQPPGPLAWHAVPTARPRTVAKYATGSSQTHREGATERVLQLHAGGACHMRWLGAAAHTLHRYAVPGAPRPTPDAVHVQIEQLSACNRETPRVERALLDAATTIFRLPADTGPAGERALCAVATGGFTASAWPLFLVFSCSGGS